MPVIIASIAPMVIKPIVILTGLAMSVILAVAVWKIIFIMIIGVKLLMKFAGAKRECAAQLYNAVTVVWMRQKNAKVMGFLQLLVRPAVDILGFTHVIQQLAGRIRMFVSPQDAAVTLKCLD